MTRLQVSPMLRRLAAAIMPAGTLIGAPAVQAANWSSDHAASQPYCRRCGATVDDAAHTFDGCPHCRGLRIPWQEVWRLGAYHEPLSTWLIDFKFHGGWAWGRWFGRELARIIPRTGEEAAGRSLVVPVPLHWRRRMNRGYDQARLIAQTFARARSLPLAPLLHRNRPTTAQTTLRSRAARHGNVRRAFGIAPVDLAGWHIWLIDDVKTTGSCARLLRHAGASSVRLAVVAVADPRSSDFKWN
jgi:ComF family protein